VERSEKEKVKKKGMVVSSSFSLLVSLSSLLSPLFSPLSSLPSLLSPLPSPLSPH
jgi:hypothetical protein